MKHPDEMSAAAINRELDAIDKKQSVLIDEFIAAGRGHERPSDWQDKSDPLSMKEKALSERRADLMHEVRRRAGPGMYRLPKGFGPMKNPATRKPGTVAAINRQIDAINRRANPAPPPGTPDRVVKLTRTHTVWVGVDERGEFVDYGFDRAYVIKQAGVSTAVKLNSSAWKSAPKKNPARTATLVARKPAAKNPARKSAKLSQTEYEVQYSRDGETWHKWTAVLYEDMAKEIAARTSKEFPKYHVRVIRRA